MVEVAAWKGRCVYSNPDALKRKPSGSVGYQAEMSRFRQRLAHVLWAITSDQEECKSAGSSPTITVSWMNAILLITVRHAVRWEVQVQLLTSKRADQALLAPNDTSE
jgi:hypothetical protein